MDSHMRYMTLTNTATDSSTKLLHTVMALSSSLESKKLQQIEHLASVGNNTNSGLKIFHAFVSFSLSKVG